MLVLDATNKSITVTMATSATTTNPDFVAAWSDDTGTSFTEGASDGALNGSSQVTLVASPAASTRRLIKSIYIENRDTVANTITVTYNNGGTLRNISKVTLQVGDTWSTDGTTDTNGNLKTIQSPVSLTSGVTGILPIANGGTNASTASITSFNNITGYTALGATGTTSTNLVFSTSPTLTTPTIGVATATSVNKVALTAPATSATLTLADGSTLVTSGAYSTTLTATATTTVTLPTTGTLATLAGSETFTNKTLTNPTVTNYVETLQAVGTVGSTSTLVLTTGTVLTATLTASTPCTFTMPTATAGKSFILKLTQASSGMTTATFTSVKFPGGTAPTITATASAVDILSFVSDGTNWYGTFAQAFA
jgi:hypothetical protein